MLNRWLTRRAVGRAAIAGLALGLVALAATAAWGSVANHRTLERVRAIGQVDDVWSRMLSRVTVEDTALRKYLDMGGGAPHRVPLVSAVRSAEPDLAWLETYGDATEARHAEAVAQRYAAYTTVLQQALDVADPVRTAGYSKLAEQYFIPLRTGIVDNIDRLRRAFAVQLDRAEHGNLVRRWIGLGLMLLNLGLCVVSSVMLVGYQRRAERELALNHYQARHDDLTGLPNRNLLVERANRAVEGARGGSRLTGLLVVDIDRFKDVNDTVGQSMGDQLLRMVAGRIRSVLRSRDTVARLGGDDFAVLLPEVASMADLSAVADRVRHTIQAPIELGGLTVDLGASVGAAAFPVDCDGAEDLIRHADAAMVVAKRSGFGARVYDPGADANDRSALSVLSELRRGIARGELVLFYQPKVDPVDLDPRGVEALVRWRHPDRGLLPPGAFLPVIEPTEFIEELTETVLRMAVSQAGSWVADGLPLPVSVNITARSLLDTTFPDRVAAVLAEHGVPAQLLTLELTESALITAPALASEALRQLRSRGIRASIDDFGTGYSSMAFLRDMPVSELKIDRTFVTTMCTDGRNHAIVDAMVELGHSLALEVVAEGVEDAQTLRSLADLGCRVIQGYHISRPLPVEELDRWLHERPVAARSG